MKEQLIFDPNEAVGTQDTVGAHLLDGDGNKLSSTDNGGKQSLDVNLTGSSGSIEVTATDLDIRQLLHTGAAPDSVQIGDGTEVLAINPDGSIAIGDGVEKLLINADGSINVNNTDQGPIRFINNLAATVAVEEDVAPLPVKLQGLSGDVNITAGDLNVQLDHTGATFDSVRVGDGTELMAITAVSDAQVVDRADTGFKVTSENIATSFTEIVATPLANRKFLRIQNRSKKPIEIAESGAATNGYVIPGGGALEIKIGPTIDLFMKGGAVEADAVRVIELA